MIYALIVTAAVVETARAKAISNSEDIKPIYNLSYVELKALIKLEENSVK